MWGNRIPAIFLTQSGAKQNIMVGYYTHNVANADCTKRNVEVDGWHTISISQGHNL